MEMSVNETTCALSNKHFLFLLYSAPIDPAVQTEQVEKFATRRQRSVCFLPKHGQALTKREEMTSSKTSVDADSIPSNPEESGDESEDESEVLEESPCGRWQKRREQVFKTRGEQRGGSGVWLALSGALSASQGSYAGRTAKVVMELPLC